MVGLPFDNEAILRPAAHHEREYCGRPRSSQTTDEVVVERCGRQRVLSARNPSCIWVRSSLSDVAPSAVTRNTMLACALRNPFAHAPVAGPIELDVVKPVKIPIAVEHTVDLRLDS